MPQEPAPSPRRRPAPGRVALTPLLAALLVCSSGSLGGCGALFGPGRPPAGGRAAVDGALRLDRSVVPQRYTLDLRLDPRGATYAGQVTIEVKVAGRVPTVRMHAAGLTIESAVVSQAGRRFTAEAVTGTDGGLSLRLPEALTTGDATLELTFHRALLRSPGGVWRLQLGEDWYAFTRFQPDRAREAFPSFDQPEFKTPFAVRITAPQGHRVIANGARQSSEPDGEGRVRHVFTETRPLPTYLVAFAVGPFDIVRGPRDGEPPLRMVTARGRRPLARYALERADELLSWQSEWFGRPYPFQKLDLLALPEATVGAMENAGLITARETLLLIDAESSDPRARLWAQLVLGHELAHSWMGNLVTPTWWDDLWLNEAFATWLAAKAVAAVDPELEADLEAIARTHWIMTLDDDAAPPMRRALPDGAAVAAAFDRITYSKGAALLRMLEGWIGEPALQQGVRAWLERFAYGNATTADLVAALDAASGQPVGAVLRPFLEHPGVPHIDATLRCAPGAPPAVELRRSRFGSGPQAAWTVPVCVRIGRAAGTARACTLLDGPEGRLPLEGACPDWIHPNADQSGYYRWSLPAPALRALLQRHRAALTPAERAGLVGQLEAQLDAGRLSLEDAMEGLIALAADDQRVVLEHLIAALARLHRTAVEPEAAPAFAALVRALLTPHLDRLGAPGEDEEPLSTTLLRPRLEDALTWLGDHDRLVSEAEALTDRFLADAESVEPEALVRALPAAARRGDLDRWEDLAAALKQDPDPVARAALVSALGAFETPALLERSLGLVLDGTLQPDEHRAVTRAIGHPEARAAAWRWLKIHYPALEERLGPQATAQLVALTAGFCDTARQDEIAAFFTAHPPPPAAGRDIDQVLQTIGRCAALRARLGAPLTAWLSARPRP